MDERDTPKAPTEVISSIISGARIPLTVADLDRNDAPLCQVNAAFSDLTGFTPAAALGRNCRFLQGDVGASDEQRQPIRAAVKDFSQGRGLLLNHRSDGTPFANYLFLFPFLEAGTGRRLMLGSQFDVTSQISRNKVEDRLDVLTEIVGPLLPDERGNMMIQNLVVLSRSIYSLIESKTLSEMMERRLP